MVQVSFEPRLVDHQSAALTTRPRCSLVLTLLELDEQRKNFIFEELGGFRNNLKQAA